MEQSRKIQFRGPMKWGELDPNRRRSTHVGMWAWLWQRISAVAIIFFLGLHITRTYIPIIQFLLLITVVFHAVLGLRVILLDFNLINVRYRNSLLGVLVGLGALIFMIIWKGIY